MNIRGIVKSLGILMLTGHTQLVINTLL